MPILTQVGNNLRTSATNRLSDYICTECASGAFHPSKDPKVADHQHQSHPLQWRSTPA